ncbi:site-specific integrase [Streptomyces sp. NPDC048611]|uniref:tyrosine-type recombinase/integrase n=1 Tax=Streptomyces sp. NPDC048611 TaxID=3155635 RepID=UPI0034237943
MITWLAAMAADHVPEGTVKQYRSTVNRLLKRFPNRKFAGITTQDLAMFLYGEGGVAVGRAPQTCTTHRSALRSFFAYGQLMGWTRTVTVVPQPVIRQRKTRPAVAPTRLTEAELLLMLERAEHPMLRALVATAICTALRISDILKIRCEEINLNTGELSVWIKKTGHFDVKPIPLDLEEEIRRYLIWYSRETGASLKTPGAYLFAGWGMRNAPGIGRIYYEMDPFRHVRYTWANERLRELFGTCGIQVEPREAWHVIRRSVARIYFDRLRQEISHDHALRQTSALLDHMNAETTEKYLGMKAEREARNTSLRGRRFLTSPGATVTPIEVKRG